MFSYSFFSLKKCVNLHLKIDLALAFFTELLAKDLYLLPEAERLGIYDRLAIGSTDKSAYCLKFSVDNNYNEENTLSVAKKCVTDKV